MIDEFKGKYSFLSNFIICPIIKDDMGIDYPTVEHYFQAQKTLDETDRYNISILETPGQAKRYGRKVKLRDDWEEIKIEVMKEGLRQKFSNSIFRTKLLLTKPHLLIEGNNWHDNFWGNCRCINCCNIKGKNWLGKLLMDIRDESVNCRR